MTTAIEIEKWFDTGVAKKATHMIVACDTFDHEDYPIYVQGDADVWKQYESHNGVNMQRVMEVYDLRMDKATQMAQTRVFNLPPKPQEEVKPK